MGVAAISATAIIVLLLSAEAAASPFTGPVLLSGIVILG